MKKTIGLMAIVFLLVSIATVSAWNYCSDTDGGKNYDVKGTVSYWGRSYTDYCVGNYVKEFYCRYGRYKSYTYYKCPNGCSDGACITTPIEYCGDGIVNQPSEECDDGNNQNGDGCDGNCQIESCAEDWQCTDWGECQGSNYWSMYKYRTCTDLNSCGTTYQKPAEKAKCQCVNKWVWQEEVINIGDPTSEAGHNLQNWGPIEPLTHGGNWGEHPTHSSCCPYGDVKAYDGNARVVSTSTTGDTASFEIMTGGYYRQNINKGLEMMVLKGISGDDSFKVYANGHLVYTFVDDGTRNPNCNGEDWVKHTIPLDKYTYNNKVTVTIESVAPHWNYYNTYGQVAVSEVISKWKQTIEVCE